jgi:hypothetical protein
MFGLYNSVKLLQLAMEGRMRRSDTIKNTYINIMKLPRGGDYPVSAVFKESSVPGF